MPPKKGKEEGNSENLWRTRIEGALLNDDKWSLKVVFIEAAGGEQDHIYLTKFEAFAAEERRFVIKNICKSETTFMINQLGGEKKVKDENLRVFEEGQSFLKEKKDIPSDIMALIIKHLILKMKDEYLFVKRQRLEVREGMRRESATMIDKTEVRGSVVVAPPEPEPAPPPPKGKKGKGEPPPPAEPEPLEGKKYNTLLRVRGEEWRDKVYVDDFPTDGPNLYVAITGFMDPFLPSNLIKIGIPLSAVVQIRIDPVLTKVPSSLFRGTKRGQSQTDIMSEKSLRFWEDLQQLRIHKTSTDLFKHTAFIVFKPPYWDAETLSGNPDKIYDELCFLMYDVQDLTRQHSHYLDNMSIIQVPEEPFLDTFSKCYHKQIEDVPLECVTVYSVMDSLLHAVCNEPQERNSRSSLSTAATLNHPPSHAEDKTQMAENLVNKVFNTLCISEENKKSYRITYGEEYEQHKNPIIINYGDSAKCTTFHIGNINLDNIIWSSLFRMPIHQLWHSQGKPENEIEDKISFHINMLLSCFERQDVEIEELYRLLHVLACRKLYNNRSSLKRHHLQAAPIVEFKKAYLKRSILAEPLSVGPSIFRSNSTISPSFLSITKSENFSDEMRAEEETSESQRIKHLFDCPDISELVSAAEIANGQPIGHMIDDFEYFEDFSGISAFQIMLEAFNKFNCLDYKYCEVTDAMIIMLFNSHDRDGISREEWRNHIPTPICLQDYFDFILDEHYDWVQSEERLYDEQIALKNQSDSKDLVDPLAATSCIGNLDIELELLMEGSLKFQEITQIEDSTQDTMETPKNTATASASSTGTDSKLTKKSKSPATSTPKILRQATSRAARISTAGPKEVIKPFAGYDLGDRRVEVFGKDSIYFSRDGTKVATYYTLLIPMNLEYIILNIVSGNGHNEFWLHKAVGENVAPEFVDACESFRVTSKDQVMINVKKETYQVPFVVTSQTDTETKHKKEVRISTDMLSHVESAEIKAFHSFCITWPNGLITECVHEPNSPNISHIKQKYMKPLTHLDETMRCISLNGEVIIFKTCGDIEVLRPDASYFNITKCGLKNIAFDSVDNHSDTGSEKSNKKQKLKDEKKKSKTSSKSSKFLTSDDDIEPELKPDYKLVIEEFEYIETSGLRQKWVNDVPFDIEKLLIRTATDFCLGEVFSRRIDGTNTLINKDGAYVVTFQNNTRIITYFVIEDQEIYPEWTVEELEYFEMLEADAFDSEKGSHSQKSYLIEGSISSGASRKVEEEEMKQKERIDGYVSVQLIYSIEHANFTTVTIDKSVGSISIESPNQTNITMFMDNTYDIKLDNSTTAKFNGETLNISYEACPECKSYTTCDVTVMREEERGPLVQPMWLKLKDSFCKKISVDEEGGINVLEEPCSEEVTIHEDTVIHAEEIHDEVVDLEQDTFDYKRDTKSETSVTSHSKCRDFYKAKGVRFFILKRDLTCSELVHRNLINQYRQKCRWQPWCSVNQYDTFGDNRQLLSILTPVNLTESEKWLMESKLSNKPYYLRYKDLKKDCGKGFYHWMRPYERFEPKPMKPQNVLPPRLPRAFILRTLELQWLETEREKLKGAKELSSAILKYRQLMAEDCETLLTMPIIDNRPEAEKHSYQLIQAIGQRVYNDAKLRMENEVQNRAKADITTRPVPPGELSSIEGETDGITDSPLCRACLADEETASHIMLDCRELAVYRTAHLNSPSSLPDILGDIKDMEETRGLEEERLSLIKEVEAAEEMSPELKRYWRRREEEYKEEQFYRYLLREGSVPPYFMNILGGAIWWEMNNTASEAVTKSERRKMKCVCTEESSPVCDGMPPLPI